MIEKTGAIDVYFEEQIEVLVEEPDLFSMSALEETLEEMKVEYTDIAEGASL